MMANSGWSITAMMVDVNDTMLDRQNMQQFCRLVHHEVSTANDSVGTNENLYVSKCILCLAMCLWDWSVRENMSVWLSHGTIWVHKWCTTLLWMICTTPTWFGGPRSHNHCGHSRISCGHNRHIQHPNGVLGWRAATICGSSRFDSFLIGCAAGATTGIELWGISHLGYNPSNHPLVAHTPWSLTKTLISSGYTVNPSNPRDTKHI